MEPAAGLEPATRCLQIPCRPLPPRPGRCHPLPGAAVLPARAPKPVRPASRLVPSSGGACRRVGGTGGGSVSGLGLASRIAPAAPRPRPPAPVPHFAPVRAASHAATASTPAAARGSLACDSGRVCAVGSGACRGGRHPPGCPWRRTASGRAGGCGRPAGRGDSVSPPRLPWTFPGAVVALVSRCLGASCGDWRTHTSPRPSLASPMGDDGAVAGAVARRRSSVGTRRVRVPAHGSGSAATSTTAPYARKAIRMD